MAEIMNYSIAIFLMFIVLAGLERQAGNTPGFKVYGMDFSKFKKLIYIAMGIFALLIILALIN